MNTLFDQFRQTLDLNQATRERIIKASRDITASSKKVYVLMPHLPPAAAGLCPDPLWLRCAELLTPSFSIFAVQRISDPYAPASPSIQTTIDNHWSDINKRFQDVKADLTGANQWRYQRNMSGCIQECIEAMSFQHYILGEKKIITVDEVRSQVPDFVLVTDEDYVLGLMDLTGELMRYAIGHLAETDTSDSSSLPPAKKAKLKIAPTPVSRRTSRITEEIVSTLQNIDIGLLGVDVYVAEKSTPALKELSKKVSTFKSSLTKVERAICSLVVQGSERSITVEI